MRVLILGIDGYLGWPTAMYLANKGHEVLGVDNYIKRKIEAQCGVAPITPISTLDDRTVKYYEITGNGLVAAEHDICHGVSITKEIDAVIHYAEQPSAPYSMMGLGECLLTQQNNITGTLELLWAVKDTDVHIIKLGTMGEYGTPNIDIEEGWINIKHNGREDRMIYPKSPASFYHASKVADSTNMEAACRFWGTRVTDLNQGVVYGVDTEETKLDKDLNTSFHYDAIFGTCINRFIVQAVAGIPLTVYGKGGQTRGWLNILDTLQCVELAMLNPPERGEFRVFNQFTEQFSVLELAERVSKLTGAKIDHIENPRAEKEEHYYNAKHTALVDLGLKPHLLTDEVLQGMIEYVERYKNNIDIEQILPKVRWK